VRVFDWFLDFDRKNRPTREAKLVVVWFLILLRLLRCFFGRMTHCFGLELTAAPALQVSAIAPYVSGIIACGDLPGLNQYIFLLPRSERVLRRIAARLGPPGHSTDLSMPASAERSP
jgi:hypothetical protein